MTRDEFLASGQIKHGTAKLLRVERTFRIVPFGKYVIHVGFSGANAYDGQKLIACYLRGKRLFVKDAYRRQGIASELMYRTYELSRRPLGRGSARTPEVQLVCESVWKRINNGG